MACSGTSITPHSFFFVFVAAHANDDTEKSSSEHIIALIQDCLGLKVARLASLVSHGDHLLPPQTCHAFLRPIKLTATHHGIRCSSSPLHSTHRTIYINSPHHTTPPDPVATSRDSRPLRTSRGILQMFLGFAARDREPLEF
jgi:hypothetical protein